MRGHSPSSNSRSPRAGATLIIHPSRLSDSRCRVTLAQPLCQLPPAVSEFDALKGFVVRQALLTCHAASFTLLLPRHLGYVLRGFGQERLGVAKPCRLQRVFIFPRRFEIG